MATHTMEELRAAMAGKDIRAMSKDIGVHENTLYRFVWRKGNGINTKTYFLLCDYLFGNAAGLKE